MFQLNLSGDFYYKLHRVSLIIFFASRPPAISVFIDWEI